MIKVTLQNAIYTSGQLVGTAEDYFGCSSIDLPV